MNNVGINICVQVFVQSHIFHSLVHVPRNGNAGSYGNYIFNFLRSCQIVFHKYLRVPTFPYPGEHLLLAIFFFVIAIPVGVKGYYFLLCHSLQSHLLELLKGIY